MRPFLFPLALMVLIPGCGPWPDLPGAAPLSPVAPELLPLAALPPAPATPPDTGEGLAAEARALQTRADALRDQ